MRCSYYYLLIFIGLEEETQETQEESGSWQAELHCIDSTMSHFRKQLGDRCVASSLCRLLSLMYRLFWKTFHSTTWRALFVFSFSYLWIVFTSSTDIAKLKADRQLILIFIEATSLVPWVSVSAWRMLRKVSAIISKGFFLKQQQRRKSLQRNAISLRQVLKKMFGSLSDLIYYLAN